MPKMRIFRHARLDDIEITNIDSALDQMPDYGETIEEEYQIYWDQIDDSKVINLLALLSRMRGTLDMSLLTYLASDSIVEKLIRSVKHYFNVGSKLRWTFFHNSFRQFILDRTGRNAFEIKDDKIHRSYHSELAELAHTVDKTSVFRWELIYHTFHSGNFPSVLDIGTQEFFRTHYLENRPSNLIFDDLTLVLKAAKNQGDFIACIRALLIEKELTQREDTLDEIDNIGLLFYLNKFNEGMKYVINEDQLLIDTNKALELAIDLSNRGYNELSKEIFELAEPLDLLSNIDVNYGINDFETTINSWVYLAARFRPTEELIKIINDIEYRSQGYDKETEKQAAIDFREGLFIEFVDSIVDCHDIEKISSLYEFLTEYIDFEIINQRVLQGILDASNKSTLLDQKLVETFLNSNHDRFSNSLSLRLAEYFYRDKKDDKTALKLFNSIDIPKRVIDVTRSHQGFSLYINRLRYYRISAALGNEIDPLKKVPDAKSHYDQGSVLIERMVILLANLWGKAWRGDVIPPSLLIREIEIPIRLTEQWDDIDLRTAFAGKIKTYLEIIVFTTAAHGAKALSELSKFFELRWNDDTKSKYWSEAKKRWVALAIYEAGGSKEELSNRLELIATSMETKDDVREYMENCVEQAKAWAKLGSYEVANKHVVLIKENSFGIYYEKDSQIFHWTDWYTHFLKTNPELSKKYFLKFVQGISTASAYSRGARSQESIISLLTTVYSIDPSCAEKLNDEFWNEFVINYQGTTEALLISLFKNDEVNIHIPISIFKRIYLPYTRYFENDVIKELVNRIVRLSYEEDKIAILEGLINSIRKEITPHKYGKWLIEVDKALRNHIGTKPMLRLIDATLSNHKPESTHTKGSITLTDNSIIEEDELINQAKSPDRLLYLINNIKKDNFYQWRNVINPLLIDLTEDQTEKLILALIKIGRGGDTTTGLLKKLAELGSSEKLIEKYALLLLKDSKPHGWEYSYDSGTRVEPYKILTQISSEYCIKAYKQFIDDCLEGYKPYRLSGVLKDLASVFWSEIPYDLLWDEIHDHISQLREFSHPAIELPNEFEFNITNDTNLSDVALNFLFKALTWTQPELREDAFKAIKTIYTESDSNRPYIEKFIAKNVNGKTDVSLISMGLIRVLSDENPNLINNFQSNLEKNLLSKDMAVAYIAKEILGVTDDLSVIRERKELPITYSLEIPEFETLEDDLTPVISQPGKVMPDTTDTLQLVGITKEALDLIHHRTQIPFRNLVERTAILMKEVLPIEEWDGNAERKVRDRCRALQIETAYIRPRSITAYLALGRLIAELFDANLISEKDIYLLKSSLSIFDFTLSQMEPNHYILSPISWSMSDEYSHRGKKWFDQQPEFTENNPITKTNENILGFITKAEVPSWERPHEKIIGSICPPYIKESDINNSVDSIIPGRMMSLWWMGDMYPHLPYLKSALESSLLIYGAAQRSEIGRTNWLAINPKIAIRLGWKMGGNGLFQWIDDDGVVMVESQWWRAGRIGRHPPSDGVYSEGWLVKASPEASEQLFNLIKSYSWIYGVKKSFTYEKKTLNKNWISISYFT